MARAGPDDQRQSLGGLGAQVDITIVPGPRSHARGERVAPLGNRITIVCLAVAIVAAGALLAGVSLTGRGATTTLLPTTVLPNTVLHPTYLRATGSVAAPSAPAFPLRCLSLLIALHDPSLRNAGFDGKLPCARSPGTAPR